MLLPVENQSVTFSSLLLPGVPEFQVFPRFHEANGHVSFFVTNLWIIALFDQSPTHPMSSMSLEFTDVLHKGFSQLEFNLLKLYLRGFLEGDADKCG
jgi:hypothetical protein